MNKNEQWKSWEEINDDPNDHFCNYIMIGGAFKRKLTPEEEMDQIDKELEMDGKGLV